MTPYRAVSLAEGIEDGTEEQVIQAWQFLIDSGLAWQLQGKFGRMAQRLIEEGLCHNPS